MQKSIFLKLSILLISTVSSIYADPIKTKKPLTVKEKKQRFHDLLVPAIKEVYNTLNKRYKEAKVMVKNKTDAHKIKKLMKEYNAKDEKDLLQRMKPHPKSIALAQAAMESGWATSRFFNIANNVFGVWSIDENEPRVPANESRKYRQIYLKKYENIADSIMDYYMMIARNKAFIEFRKEKMLTDDPHKLVQKLDKYSEQGKKYSNELSKVIKYNKFHLLDKE